MKPEQISAIALEVADELNKVKRAGQSFSARDNVIDDYAVRFATRFLAAITEKAEPVALYPCGFKKLHSLVIEMGAFLAQGLTEDEPVTEAIRSAAMVLVGYAKDMSSLLAKHPLYTHPPFEQERCAAKPDAFPQAHRLALELECLLLSCQDNAAVSKWWDSAHEALEQWREFCSVAPPEPAPQQEKEESGDYGHTGSSAVCAAPLPDDVAKMVEQLRESHCHETADMLERLARQVPPDCVVVPKWLFEQLKHYSISHLLCYPNCGAPSEKEIEEAMIAAGQINLNQGETK